MWVRHHSLSLTSSANHRPLIYILIDHIHSLYIKQVWTQKCAVQNTTSDAYLRQGISSLIAGADAGFQVRGGGGRT